jgi:hypothetical protein
VTTSASDVQALLDPEREYDVLLWQFEQLHQAGYHEGAASDLAICRSVDLHLATDLITHGCPEKTALRILR